MSEVNQPVNPINRDLKYRLSEMTTICIPVVVEQSFVVLMGIISGILVASQGEAAISAVNIVDSVSQLVISLFSALTVGGTVVVGRYVGKKDEENATKAAAQSIILAFMISIVVSILFMVFREQIMSGLLKDAAADVKLMSHKFFFIVNFSFPILAIMQTNFGVIRGTGDTRTPMLISLIMNVLNVVLGYVLINGFFFIPSFGIVGAAVSLVVSRFLGMVLTFVYLLKFSKIIKLRHKSQLKPDFSVQKIILNLGIPTSIESSLFQVGKIITQSFIISMGTQAIVANSVGGAITGFICVPGNALATGLMIIVSQRVGKGEIDDVKKTVWFATVYGMVCLSITCLIFFPLSNKLIDIYKVSPHSAELTKQILHSGYIAIPLLWSPSFLTPAGLRAVGDVRFTMVIAIASMWTFRIASGYVLGIYLNVGILGVWIGMYIDWIVRSIFFAIRILSGKWLKNIGVGGA